MELLQFILWFGESIQGWIDTITGRSIVLTGLLILVAVAGVAFIGTVRMRARTKVENFHEAESARLVEGAGTASDMAIFLLIFLGAKFNDELFFVVAFVMAVAGYTGFTILKHITLKQFFDRTRVAFKQIMEARQVMERITIKKDHGGNGDG